MISMQSVVSSEADSEPREWTGGLHLDELEDLFLIFGWFASEPIDVGGAITIIFDETDHLDQFLEITAGSHSSAPGSLYQAVVQGHGISLCAVVVDGSQQTGLSDARPSIHAEIGVRLTYTYLGTVCDQLWSHLGE